VPQLGTAVESRGGSAGVPSLRSSLKVCVIRSLLSGTGGRGSAYRPRPGTQERSCYWRQAPVPSASMKKLIVLWMKSPAEVDASMLSSCSPTARSEGCITRPHWL
jgi:hypothetical protein